MPLFVDVPRLTWKLPVDGMVCVEAVWVLAPAEGGTTISRELVGQSANLAVCEGRYDLHKGGNRRTGELTGAKLLSAI